MTLFLDINEVYCIHAAIIKRAGTTAGIRDFSLLHSAVERPRATFEGKSLYPSPFIKAAALLQSLCLNHAFSDGNKRTAWGATKRFLWNNGYHLQSASHDAADFLVFVDNIPILLRFEVFPKTKSGLDGSILSNEGCKPELRGYSKPDIHKISFWLKNHSVKRL